MPVVLFHSKRKFHPNHSWIVLMRNHGCNYRSYVIRLVERVVQKERIKSFLECDFWGLHCGENFGCGVLHLRSLSDWLACYQFFREPCDITSRLHDHIRQQTTIQNSLHCATSGNSITSCVWRLESGCTDWFICFVYLLLSLGVLIFCTILCATP